MAPGSTPTPGGPASTNTVRTMPTWIISPTGIRISSPSSPWGTTPAGTLWKTAPSVRQPQPRTPSRWGPRANPQVPRPRTSGRTIPARVPPMTDGPSPPLWPPAVHARGPSAYKHTTPKSRPTRMTTRDAASRACWGPPWPHRRRRERRFWSASISPTDGTFRITHRLRRL